MHTLQDAPVAEKDPKIKIELNEQIDLGEGMQNGFDAIGKVFGGLVGAIKDAVGPDVIKNLEVASWLGQLSECIEKISIGLNVDGSVPAEPSGQFAFCAGQFDTMLEGSRLEAQESVFGNHLKQCQLAIENAATDPAKSATTLSHAAGYFKAAAASCLPISGNSTADADE